MSDGVERVPLDRERILDAALEIADGAGLDSLSMRHLGRRLGVEAMSLYHHLPNKSAVVDGIVDRVWSEVTITPHSDWRVAVRRTARSAFVTLLKHPWANRVRATSGGPARLAYIDASLGHLRRGGFPADEAFHAHHVLEAFIQGYVTQALDFAPTDDSPARASEAIAALDAEALPWLVEHIGVHATGTEGSGFDVGLDLITRGLERRIGAD